MRLATSRRQREHAFIGRELCASVDRLPAFSCPCAREGSPLPQFVRLCACERACAHARVVLIACSWLRVGILPLSIHAPSRAS